MACRWSGVKKRCLRPEKAGVVGSVGSQAMGSVRSQLAVQEASLGLEGGPHAIQLLRFP